jgi:hypothetical protein
MHEAYSNRAFAHRGGHPFDRAFPDITTANTPGMLVSSNDGDRPSASNRSRWGPLRT